MAVIAFLLVVSSITAVVWWRRTHRIPTPPAGLLATLVDQARDLAAPLYPSKPLSRRALPRRLLRAAEQTITVGVSGMVLVPTRIRIAVNPADLEPFADAMEWLRRDVADALRQRATANGWIVPDGPDVVIVPDEQRPVRLPRAVGRIAAFDADDVLTPRRPGPPFELSESPEPTPMTSVVVGPEGTAEGTADDADLATVRQDPTIHVRLVSVAEQPGEVPEDLNALLVAGGPPLVLGRSREADLRVRDRQVSARHCTLSIDPEHRTVVVQDLRSTNGTYVDGHRIDRATLPAGAVLRLGSTSWRIALDPLTSDS